MTVDELIDLFHEGPALSDIRAILRPLHFFDFDGYPIRMWKGVGRLYAGGQWWQGTVDANGRDHLSAPAYSDGRDGSVPLYSFEMPFIDRATYLALRDERWRIVGRRITRYVAAFQPGEGLRPETPIEFDTRFEMQGLRFAESLVSNEDDVLVRQYPVTLTATNGNAGRSQAKRGTYSPTGQKERAFERFGIVNDKGCNFIPPLANKTYLRP